MGGFSSILGHVAGGFEQARQEDLQRQFADEQNRREMAGSLLQHIALDENQHPDVRNAALSSYMDLSQMPGNKNMDFKKSMGPVFDTMAQVAGRQKAAANAPAPPLTSTFPGPQAMGAPSGPPVGRSLPSISMPPLPPGIAGPPQAPSAPGSAGLSQPRVDLGQSAQFTPPPAPPETLLAGAPEVTANLAARAQALTAAQAGQEMGGQVYQMQPQGGLSAVPVMKSGAPGPPIPNAISPYMLQGRGLDTKAYIDPATGQLALGTYNKVTKQMFDQENQVVPGALPFEPSLVARTTSGETTTPGGMTTTTAHTVTPHIRNGTPGMGMTALPTQGGGTGTGAGSGGRATGATTKLPPAVQAAMQNIQLYGEPEGKLSDAQAIAVDQLRAQGIDPSVMATMASRSMADKARNILPLIQHARQLVTQDPQALGPLKGRWSDLQAKLGDLSGPAKELAGTLVSIYSIAGGMHGWRASGVADEFQNKYGGLSSTPASLNSGLDALEGTANTIIKTAYPGMTAPPKQKSWHDQFNTPPATQ